MSENLLSRVSQPVDEEGVPTIWISFCNELGIYHCHREAEGEESSDEKFTRNELLDIVEGLMKSGQLATAQQLAGMCAWARLFAHKIVVFYTSGSFKIFNPTPPPPEEQEDTAEMKKFLAEWNAKHPTSDTIPTVVGYRSTSSKETR
jgi:hypothetical protein